MNLAINRPLDKAGIINVTPSHDSFGTTDAKLIKPADPLASILLQRMNRRGRGQMPPLGSSLIDESAVHMITQWINQMPAEAPAISPTTPAKP